MSTPDDTKVDPLTGVKVPMAGKLHQVANQEAAKTVDAGETEAATQSRQVEVAFDRALGRIPPG